MYCTTFHCQSLSIHTYPVYPYIQNVYTYNTQMLKYHLLKHLYLYLSCLQFEKELLEPGKCGSGNIIVEINTEIWRIYCLEAEHTFFSLCLDLSFKLYSPSGHHSAIKVQITLCLVNCHPAAERTCRSIPNTILFSAMVLAILCDFK